jgi:serine/threonine protein kinase
MHTFFCCCVVRSYVVDMDKEIEAHRHLMHPNIVQLIGFVYEPEKELGILMSYEKYGNADKFFRLYSVPSAWKIKMAYEIALGLNYLHTIEPHPIIHGDIKLVNVLVGNEYVAKVIVMRNSCGAPIVACNVKGDCPASPKFWIFVSPEPRNTTK